MATSHSPAPIDPRDMDRAASTWDGFTKLMTVGTVAVIIVVAAMAVFLI